jgi:hypothetical protein
VVRGVSQRRLAHVRPAQQYAAHRAHSLARGRDAADVALNTTFGPNTLKGFKVWAHDARFAPD